MSKKNQESGNRQKKKMKWVTFVTHTMSCKESLRQGTLREGDIMTWQDSQVNIYIYFMLFLLFSKDQTCRKAG